MTINKTTTDLSTLKINYLTQEMYEDALENDEINENELYITPGSSTIDSTSTPTANKIAEFDSTARMSSEDMSSTEVNNFVGNLGYTFNLIDVFYPVGSYYETSDSTFDPNITWGGTWSREDWLSTDEYDITTVFNTDKTANTTYTATRSGFILFSVLSSARNYISMLLNNVNIVDVCASSATASTSEAHEVIIPMKVGDILSINGLTTTGWIASTRNKFFAYKIIGNRWHRTA